MCRKLETEEEKVLPFYASTLTAAEEKEINDMVQQEPENELAKVQLFLKVDFHCIFGILVYLLIQIIKGAQGGFFGFFY